MAPVTPLVLGFSCPSTKREVPAAVLMHIVLDLPFSHFTLFAQGVNHFQLLFGWHIITVHPP